MNSSTETRRLSGYVICTMGRSGSNYLCQLLSATGVLGTPKEYFNADACRRRGEPNYPSAPLAQMDWLLTKSPTPNGIYGLKVFPHQIDTIVPLRWADRLPAPRFISLTRDDLLDQAISFSRAHQTGQWRAIDAELKTPQYERAEILHHLKFVAQSEARWRVFFARNGIDPLRLSYEAILEDPQGAVDRIAQYVGLAEPATIRWDEVDIAVQRDEQNAVWRERFLTEMSDANAIDQMDGVAITLERCKTIVRRVLNRLRQPAR